MPKAERVSVCRFRRDQGKDWEAGVAVLDTLEELQAIIDMNCQPLAGEPYEFYLMSQEGSFRIPDGIV